MYSTEGIVLKKYDIGEADALFSIYTKDFGKIRAVAQGVKKESAKLKGHLEPFSRVSIQFVIAKNGERLTHAELLDFWPQIRGRVGALKRAWYVAELIDRHCLPGERDDAMWQLLSSSLEALESGNSDDHFVPHFEEKLSAYLGYEGQDLRDLGVSVARPW